MSIWPPPPGVSRGLKTLIWLKNYDVQKQQITFTLGLNAGENTDYMEKSFKYKAFRIEFPTKMSMGAYVYLLPEWSKWLERLKWLKYCNVQKWQLTFTLEQLLIFNRLLSTLSIIFKEGSYKNYHKQ